MGCAARPAWGPNPTLLCCVGPLPHARLCCQARMGPQPHARLCCQARMGPQPHARLCCRCQARSGKKIPISRAADSGESDPWTRFSVIS